jgi:membrane protein implicated in regulation of membrane protease activity
MDGLSPQDYPWIWIGIGTIAMVLEFIVPGMFIFFVGFSMTVTGLLMLWLPLSTLFQFLIFSIVCIFSIIFGSAFIKKFFPSEVSEDRMIKDDYVNQIVAVTEDILLNQKGGRVHFRGTEWDAYSTTERIPSGEKVRILSRDNLTFIVERIHR